VSCGGGRTEEDGLVTDRKDALRTRLVAGRVALTSSLDSMREEDWDRPTTNPSWTARDILTHLSIAEPGLLARMRRILEGTSALQPGFDLNVYNQRQVSKRQGESVAILRAALDESRPQVLAFLDRLSDEQLEIRGWHASGREVTLADMFEILADHEETHARDILTARQA
jgi:uncharacterized protein (TIGR03083 family)